MPTAIHLRQLPESLTVVWNESPKPGNEQLTFVRYAGAIYLLCKNPRYNMYVPNLEPITPAAVSVQVNGTGYNIAVIDDMGEVTAEKCLVNSMFITFPHGPMALKVLLEKVSQAIDSRDIIPPISGMYPDPYSEPS